MEGIFAYIADLYIKSKPEKENPPFHFWDQGLGQADLKEYAPNLRVSLFSNAEPRTIAGKGGGGRDDSLRNSFDPTLYHCQCVYPDRDSTHV